MKGEVDTSFFTHQRDLFTSGMAKQIGMNAFGVWLAIKSHADYNTGEAWPGMRRLSELTGLSLAWVQRCVTILVDAKLLRVLEEGKGRKSARYVARERLDVRLGSRVICTILVDYVPARLKERLQRIEGHISGARDDPGALALATILPGPGFAWDEAAGELRAQIPVSEIPAPSKRERDEEQDIRNDLQRRVLELKKTA